jgi:hypothetical protein
MAGLPIRSGGGTDSHIDDLDDLCHHAIAKPSLMSRADKSRIMHWPDLEEEDRLLVLRSGQTGAEITAKAISHPEDMSEEEAMVATSPLGFHYTFETNQIRTSLGQNSSTNSEIRRRSSCKT